MILTVNSNKSFLVEIYQTQFSHCNKILVLKFNEISLSYPQKLIKIRFYFSGNVLIKGARFFTRKSSLNFNLMFNNVCNEIIKLANRKRCT